MISLETNGKDYGLQYCLRGRQEPPEKCLWQVEQLSGTSNPLPPLRPPLQAPRFFRLRCEPWPVGWTKEWAVWEMEEDLAEGPEPLWRLWLPRRDDPASC